MMRNIIAAFVTFTIIVLVSMSAWTVFRITRITNLRIEETTVGAEEIEQALVSAFLSDRSFASNRVSELVQRRFLSDHSLLALVVSGERTEYLFARSPDYLSIERSADGELTSAPDFAVTPIRDRIVSSRMVFPDNRVFTLSILSRILYRDDLLPIVRELMIALLSFLLITAVFIVTLPAYAAKRARAEAAETASTEEPDRDMIQAIPAVSDSLEDEPVQQPALASTPPGSSTVRPRSTLREGLYSPDTGLGWEEYLEERLTTELKRAASFDQDLVLILFSTSTAERDAERFRALAAEVREYFTFRDLCFEYGSDGIGVIVPNIDLDQGIEKFEDFLKSRSSREKSSSPEPEILAGLSSRNGRLMNGHTLIREAGRALEKAREGREPLIAFRVDPDKYRSWVASRS